MVLGPAEFQDRAQCAFVNTFYLIRIETELLFVTIPVILAFVAIVVVSVYALKLQIRLSREIQPTVNLPTENVIPTQLRQPQEVEEERTTIESNRIRTNKNSELPSNSNDIQIIDLENADTEKITIERIPTDRNIIEEEQESIFSIKRINSDPNHFFRVPKETRLTPMTMTMIVDRILMINIPALCLALDLSFSASMRLYFVSKVKKTFEDKVLGVVLIFFQFFFWLTYVFLVRKRLCKH